jgi:hypothetical protein
MLGLQIDGRFRPVRSKSLRIVLGALLLLPSALGVAADGPPARTTTARTTAEPPPSFEAVTKEVKHLLALDPGYQAGDLLTVPKVERVLAKLEKIHWKVADGNEILKLVLSESDWMAARFSTPDGKQFMRQIAGMPGGYDRVDRLRRMPRGKSNINDFIENPEGFKMIEYMTTTKGGQNLGEQLSEAEDGADFNKPTGRIYTEQDLLKRLKQSYEAEDERRHGQDPKQSTKSAKWGSRKSTPKAHTKPGRTTPAAPQAEEPKRALAPLEPIEP